MKKLLLLITVVAFLFSSCTTIQQVSMYNWAGYEDVSFKFLKKRTEEDTENLITCYENIINEAHGLRKVPPPGICADYGYLLLQQDKIKVGISYLKLEKEYYPESSVFIDKIIKIYEEE